MSAIGAGAALPRVCLALDIEKTGCRNLRDPIIAIGWCIGTENGAILEKNQIHLAVQWPTLNANGSVRDYGDFEERCWTEFWINQRPELITMLQENALSQQEGIRRFADFLDTLESTYSDDLRILSDNASYDIAALDVNLERYTSRNPLRYTRSGEYRSIRDPSDMLNVFPKPLIKKLTAEHVAPFAQHDHNPANDAEFIYRQWLLVLRLKAPIQSFYGLCA